MNIDRDRQQIFVEPHHRWSAASRERTHRAFAHPILVDQLLHDLRNGASSKARTPGQIGTRNRLAGSDQFENDVPVDDPGRLTRSELHFGQIDTFYALPLVPQLIAPSITNNATNLLDARITGRDRLPEI